MIAQWATTVAFKAGLYDWHRLNTRSRHLTLRIKGSCSSDLMARFWLKRLSSKGLACFYPTINPLRGRRCDWWITQPTQASAAWPYYQKYENTCPRFKGRYSWSHCAEDCLWTVERRIYLYLEQCTSVWVGITDVKRGVWGLNLCILYVDCNMTPNHLTDSLVIITVCRCGELKPGSLWLPTIW